jgi:dephospho-CoA kinase
MLKVALTGGIATGKSVCLARFRTLGAPTLDADIVARQVVSAGTPGLAAVVARFGRSVLAADGTLNRPVLARTIFADAAARHDLEAIVHPLVYAHIAGWLESLTARIESSAAPPAPAAIVDIPLLYETGRAASFDRVVVAACTPDQQRQRLIERDGFTRTEALLRIAAQMPIDEKRALADFVIDTSGSLEETWASVDATWDRLVTPDRAG